MRPQTLFSLFAEVTSLNGVGPGAKKALGRLLHGQESARTIVRDVAFHLPVGVIDRRNSPTLADAAEGDLVTLIARVDSHHAPQRGRGARRPYTIICHSAQGYITLVFFHAKGDYLLQSLPVNAERVISGRLERSNGRPQITHPDIIAPKEAYDEVCKLEPVYPLTGGMTNRHLTKIAHAALRRLPELPEWLDAEHLRRQGWRNWKTSLSAVHHPEVSDDLSPLSSARARLAYDELLSGQLALALVRRQLKRPSTHPVPPGERLRTALAEHLPYRLTQGQIQVLAEIDADLQSESRMLRLLQGDVGSGKTVVALMTMLSAVEAGRQAALLVPTEILGRQHLASIARMVAPLGLRVQLLTGGMKPQDHARALAAVTAGEVDIVIGTHAVLSEKVVFRDLAVAVVDEQHRFGVAQRLSMGGKGAQAHMLVMTATPIPRTLAMTLYGDMDCSVLAEKPAGRRDIATKAIPLSRAEDVLEGVARALTAGEKVYWICPLVEEDAESETPSDLAAAQARYVEFTHRFGETIVSLAHGRMSALDRDAAMAQFAGAGAGLLVATTVVEVGVDVPEATIIVIEHAERFGLAQLHQLRGRVGRSDRQSSCLLLYADKAGETARARLSAIRATNDGFRIAEDDLRLRGGGEALGMRQSGMPGFRFADLSLHAELLETARRDAELIMQRDAALASARGQALRCLLHLFSHDDNIRFLEAG